MSELLNQTGTSGKETAPGTLSDFKKLFDSTAPAAPGEDQGGLVLTEEQEHVLEAWRRKFVEEFRRAKSTSERLLVIDGAPYGHFANAGVLEENYMALGNCLAETIDKAASWHEVEFIENYLKGRYKADPSLALSSLRSFLDKKFALKKGALSHSGRQGTEKNNS